MKTIAYLLIPKKEYRPIPFCLYIMENCALQFDYINSRKQYLSPPEKQLFQTKCVTSCQFHNQFSVDVRKVVSTCVCVYVPCTAGYNSYVDLLIFAWPTLHKSENGNHIARVHTHTHTRSIFIINANQYVTLDFGSEFWFIFHLILIYIGKLLTFHQKKV